MRALLAAAAVLVAAAGVGAAQRERDLQGQVALALLPTGGVESQVVWELTGRTALVRWTAEVRNDGPRPVRVVRADLGALRDDPTPRDLGAGERLSLWLTRVVRCVDPKGGPVPDALSVQVSTPRGPRTASLPVGAPVRAELDRAADRACGVLPLDEALAIRASAVERRAGTVVVALEAANVSSRPLRLARAVVQQGLRGRTLDPTGAPLDLPLDLPPTAPGDEPVLVPLLLEITVVRCSAVDQLTPAPPGALSVDTLAFGVDDGASERLVGPVLLDLNDRAVRILTEEAC